MRNLALIGPQKSGKSTLATLLAKENGYARVGISDAIKELAGKAYPQHFPTFNKNDSTIVRDYSGEQSIESRHLLQQMGAAIRSVDLDFWLKCFRRSYMQQLRAGNLVVVDDVRLDREASFLRHIDPTVAIVRVYASARVREQRGGRELIGVDDITETGWKIAEPDFELDTSELRAEDAHMKLLEFMEVDI